MNWQKAKIIKSSEACIDIKSIVLEPEINSSYKAGQHYELRIPQSNISRKYSVVSNPSLNQKNLEFGIQLIPNGELSPKLWSLKTGDEVEIRGPLGESFVWEKSISGPLILIGAGSGITPLISIYNSYTKECPENKCVFIMSAKDQSRIMNYDQLKNILVTKFTATDSRIDLDFLKKNIGELAHNKNTMCYVCGSDNFIDDMVDNILELGISENNIKSERFI